MLPLVFLNFTGLHLQSWPKIVLEPAAHCSANSASSAATGYWLCFFRASSPLLLLVGCWSRSPEKAEGFIRQGKSVPSDGTDWLKGKFYSCRGSCGLSQKTQRWQRGGCCCLLLLTFVGDAAWWCCLSRARGGADVGRAHVPFDLTMGENGGRWLLRKSQLPEPCVSSPSRAMSSGCRSRPDVLLSAGTPCTRRAFHFQLVTGMQHAQTVKSV